MRESNIILRAFDEALVSQTILRISAWVTRSYSILRPHRKLKSERRQTLETGNKVVTFIRFFSSLLIYKSPLVFSFVLNRRLASTPFHKYRLVAYGPPFLSSVLISRAKTDTFRFKTSGVEGKDSATLRHVSQRMQGLTKCKTRSETLQAVSWCLMLLEYTARKISSTISQIFLLQQVAVHQKCRMLFFDAKKKGVTVRGFTR